MTDTIATYVEKIEQMKLQLADFGKTVFREETAKLFEDFSLLESFSWEQYTPYFNDGSECTFSVGSDWFHLVYDGKEYSSDEYKYNSAIDQDLKEDLKLISTAIETLLSFVPADVMLSIFGDHAKVIMSRDNIVVEEYEHE